MYLESLDSFIQQAEDLYRSNPLHTRYVIKYRHCDGKLVLKVTDNVTCLQYKTDQQADLKKIERLNHTFFALMATGEGPKEMDVEMKQQPRQMKERRKG